jgi:hypothetical protein
LGLDDAFAIMAPVKSVSEASVHPAGGIWKY